MSQAQHNEFARRSQTQHTGAAGPLPSVLQVITDTERRGAQIFATGLHRSLTGQQVPIRTRALTFGRHGQLDWPALGAHPLGLRTLTRLRQAALSADVLLAQGSRTLPASALATLGTSVPFVYRSIGQIDRWASTPGRRARVRAFLRRSDQVVALWDGAAAVLIRDFGVPEHRVTVIPRGVPAEDYPPVTPDERAAERDRLGFGPEDAVVAYVGSLTAEKDVGTAVRAVGGLSQVALLIVGTGPTRGAVEGLAADVAPGRVRLLGALPHVRPVLAAADVLVLSSRTEGVSGVPIEAGLCGLPSVVTNVGGMAEVVIDGMTGALVEPGSVTDLRHGIERVLIESPRLGAAARRHCLRRFSMDVVAQSWLDLLRPYGR